MLYRYPKTPNNGDCGWSRWIDVVDLDDIFESDISDAKLAQQPGLVNRISAQRLPNIMYVQSRLASK